LILVAKLHKKSHPAKQNGFFLYDFWRSLLISVDFVDSNTRLGKLKVSFRLLSLLI